jgi:aldehyde oxidoreductase
MSAIPVNGRHFSSMIDILRPKYEAALKKAADNSTDEVKRGVGIAIGVYSAGLDGPDSSEAWVELTQNNDVIVGSSWEDHGQEADMGAQGTAHEALRPLGLPIEKIGLLMNDTSKTPNSGPAGGSRSQVMTGNAIRIACETLLESIKKSDGSYRTYDEMVAENIPVRYDGKWIVPCNDCDENGQGKPFCCYMYGLFMVKVAVELKTGKTQVEKMILVSDVGSINNRLMVDGQMYGGLA